MEVLHNEVSGYFMKRFKYPTPKTCIDAPNTTEIEMLIRELNAVYTMETSRYYMKLVHSEASFGITRTFNGRSMDLDDIVEFPRPSSTVSLYFKDSGIALWKLANMMKYEDRMIIVKNVLIELCNAILDFEAKDLLCVDLSSANICIRPDRWYKKARSDFAIKPFISVEDLGSWRLFIIDGDRICYQSKSDFDNTTFPIAAPETLLKTIYNNSNHSWMIAMNVLVFIFGSYPFMILANESSYYGDLKLCMKRVIRKYRSNINCKFFESKFEVKIPDYLHEVLDEMLAFDHKTRISCRQALGKVTGNNVESNTTIDTNTIDTNTSNTSNTTIDVLESDKYTLEYIDEVKKNIDLKLKNYLGQFDPSDHVNVTNKCHQTFTNTMKYPASTLLQYVELTNPKYMAGVCVVIGTSLFECVKTPYDAGCAFDNDMHLINVFPTFLVHREFYI
jgi:serine/threonine protein kinase